MTGIPTARRRRTADGRGAAGGNKMTRSTKPDRRSDVSQNEKKKQKKNEKEEEEENNKKKKKQEIMDPICVMANDEQLARPHRHPDFASTCSRTSLASERALSLEILQQQQIANERATVDSPSQPANRSLASADRIRGSLSAIARDFASLHTCDWIRLSVALRNEQGNRRTVR